MKRSSRVTTGVLGLMIVLPGALRAEGPTKKTEAAKPPWLRLLQGEDAKRAAEQEKELTQLQEAGKFIEALKIAEELAAFRKKTQGADHWQAINARFQVEAIRRVQKASEEDQKNYRRIPALQQEAEALEAKRRYPEAQSLFEQVLAIRRKVLGEEHLDTTTSYNNIGNALYAQRKYKEAEEVHSKACAIRRKLLPDEHPEIAACYTNAALNLSAQGKYKEAEEGYYKALAIKRQVLGEEHASTAASYTNLAHNWSEQGQYKEAQEGYCKALAIRRKVLGEEHPHTAASFGNVASVLARLGRYKEAEEGYRKALVIYRKTQGEEHLNTATAYYNLAYNLDNQGRYKEAEEGYRKALAVRLKLLGEEHPLIGDSYLGVASNLDWQRKYKEAEEGYRKALAIYRKVLREEHLDTALAYNNLADNLDSQGQHKEAEEDFRKALAIRRKILGEEHPETADLYNNLAYNLDIQGQHKEAEEGFRKALAIYHKMLGDEHPDTASCYGNRAYNLYVQGKYREAEPFFLQAVSSFAKVRQQVAVTGLQRAAFTSEYSPLPRLTVVLAHLGKLDDAWQRFEESLACGTWDDLTARLRRPQSERDQQTQLIARIDRLNQLLADTNADKPTDGQTKQREELLSQLRRAYEDLSAFTQQLEKKYGPAAGQIFPRGQIQAALPSDTALVGWLDIAGKYQAADRQGEHWAILLRSAGPAVFVQLPGSGDKGAWTDADTQLPVRLRETLQSSHGVWQPLAQLVRKQRLDPLAKHLQGIRRLIVLPSTALAGVPVEVIAEDYTVSYAHSGTMHTHLLRQPTPTGKGLFVLADPVFDTPKGKEKQQANHDGDRKWERLPGTRIEAASLQRLFDNDTPIQILLDSDASEQRLNDLAQRGELSKYRYIHLATHGEVNDSFPLRSAVILSRDHLPDEKQRTELLLSGQSIPDGRLEAEEALARWNLHCDLVTLSACQTALGKYENGEGFVGFAQALILCGTRSVCLSLWKVDDTATALLMERFYQNLLGKREGLKSPMPKALALAEAKAWLRNLPRQEAIACAAWVVERGSRAKGADKLSPLAVPAAAKTKVDDRPFAHPYYWAAFVLVGHAD